MTTEYITVSSVLSIAFVALLWVAARTTALRARFATLRQPKTEWLAVTLIGVLLLAVGFPQLLASQYLDKCWPGRIALLFGAILLMANLLIEYIHTSRSVGPLRGLMLFFIEMKRDFSGRKEHKLAIVILGHALAVLLILLFLCIPWGVCGTIHTVSNWWTKEERETQARFDTLQRWMDESIAYKHIMANPELVSWYRNAVEVDRQLAEKESRQPLRWIMIQPTEFSVPEQGARVIVPLSVAGAPQGTTRFVVPEHVSVPPNSRLGGVKALRKVQILGGVLKVDGTFEVQAQVEWSKGVSKIHDLNLWGAPFTFAWHEDEYYKKWVATN